jgi:stearoyl-CoA desaturase (delta-9 desaturase)
MPTRDWVAVHRCHHAHVDTDRDPHSPIVYGIWRVVVFGTHLYHAAARNDEICEQYGKGTPSDWVERHIYQPFSLLGPGVTLITNVLLFGAAGIAMWLVEMAWTCGESLHNNHHHIQNSVRFSMRPGEIDLGYYYVRALQRLRLAAVRAR